MVVVIRYQWLQEYQKLEEEIEILKWKIRKSEVELERWCDPRDLGKVKITHESNASHLEENIKRDKAFLGEKEFAMESLMIMIDRFKGIENQILKKKYIEGKTLEIIAQEINYSYSHIKAKHAELKRRIDFIDEYENNANSYSFKLAHPETHIFKSDLKKKKVLKRTKPSKCRIVETNELY